MLSHVKYFKYTIHIKIVIKLKYLQILRNGTERQDIQNWNIHHTYKYVCNENKTIRMLNDGKYILKQNDEN